MSNITGIEETVLKVNRSREHLHIFFDRLDKVVWAEFDVHCKVCPLHNDMAVIKVAAPKRQFINVLDMSGKCEGDYEIKITASKLQKLCEAELDKEDFKNWEAQYYKAAKL